MMDRCMKRMPTLRNPSLEFSQTVYLTEKDLLESTFSNCWHAAFLQRHPTLSERISQADNRKKARQWTDELCLQYAALIKKLKTEEYLKPEQLLELGNSPNSKQTFSPFNCACLEQKIISSARLRRSGNRIGIGIDSQPKVQMFSFEGDHRKRPPQFLRGSNRVEGRNETTRRAEEDRRQREELRKKIARTVKLQSLARRFLVRHQQKALFLGEMEQLKSELSSTQDLSRLLHFLRAANIYFFREGSSGGPESRAIFFLCHNMIRLKDACLVECAKDWKSALTMAKFIGGSLELAAAVSLIDCSPSESNSVLRLAEIIIGNETLPKQTNLAVCVFLIKRHFFRSCLTILKSRSNGLTLTSSSTPVGALQLSLLSLLVAPLNILLEGQALDSAKLAMSFFCNQVLSTSREKIVNAFVIRSLAEQSKVKVPVVAFSTILAALISDVEKPFSADIWLCWSLMVLLNQWIRIFIGTRNPAVLRILSFALAGLFSTPTVVVEKVEPVSMQMQIEEEDEDEDMEAVLTVTSAAVAPKTEETETLQEAKKEIEAVLENPAFISMMVESLDVKLPTSVDDAAGICTALIINPYQDGMIMPTLFYKFAFNTAFLRSLWQRVNHFGILPSTSLNAGTTFDFASNKPWIQLYAVFCKLLICIIATVYDDEFSSDDRANTGTGFEFSLDEVVLIAASARDVASGMVFLAYTPTPHQTDPEYARLMSHLFISVVQLIKELHDRDARRAFCPDGFWASPRLIALADRTKRTVGQRDFIYDIFEKLNPFKPLKNFPTAGATFDELRFSLVVDQMPCLLPFQQRLLFVYLTLKAEKNAMRSEFDFLRPDSHAHVKVRRDYIYEDSFTDLDRNVVQDMRKPIKVTFQNLAGLDEAGVDGGGLFREFMGQTLRAGFDANRGIFRTNADSALYPNPEATILFPHNYREHFFFLGRMLGKAIYENLLTELHFADFFLKKLLAKNNLGNVDIHYLKSLDPTLFKNLLSLKQFSGDFVDLALDFSVAVDEMGVTRQVDLKPNGRNILVNKENVIEYIFLMADFKLNKQIKHHTAYFREGLSDVVPIQLLQIFNFRELQTLISGAEEPIDVRDWRRNTVYGSPYDEEHPTIQLFWKIVQSFSEESKRKLLKFVTSVSRPPLLGFKDLPHKFTINPVTGQDRLPTASTCMSLLKLPNVGDETKLRQKLLYAIESDSGFELS
ncbi:Ubiquitin-protein ligase E3C [Hypsibius exemplaris]|uniref:HECT-type E3 ubiquitin transferase n=1 Tax=Hypsibius exemplaris TaxID=2072580 RepID=A0A1W0X8B0_HYPEX|nr:Ubiquitin-protein ligase E3C [Hypsibius exemplaris]